MQEWRASGVSMSEFSRSKEYAASNLSYWARRLASESTAPKSVRMARVVRSRPEASPPAPTVKGLHHPAPETRGLVVESGALRVRVPDTLDVARLEAVLLAVTRAVKAGAG